MKKCYEKNFQWYFLQSGSSFIFPKLNWILSLKALNPFDTKWIRFEWEPNLAGYFCSSLLFKLLNTWPNMQCYYMYNFNTCKNCNIKQNNLNICCIILLCLCVLCVSVCVQYPWRIHKTTCGNQFTLSTLWVQEIELGLSDFVPSIAARWANLLSLHIETICIYTYVCVHAYI